MNTTLLLMVTIALWLVVTVCEKSDKKEQERKLNIEKQRALV